MWLKFLRTAVLSCALLLTLLYRRPLPTTTNSLGKEPVGYDFLDSNVVIGPSGLDYKAISLGASLASLALPVNNASCAMSAADTKPCRALKRDFLC